MRDKKLHSYLVRIVFSDMFLCWLCLLLLLFRTEGVVRDIDEEIDFYIDQLNDAISFLGYDEMPLPEFSFPVQVSFLSGESRMEEGRVLSLGQFRRTRVSEFETVGNRCIIKVTAGLESSRVFFDRAAITIVPIIFSKWKVNAFISTESLSLKLVIEHLDGHSCTASLQGLNLSAGDIQVEVNGIFSKLFNLLFNKYVENNKAVFIKNINDEIEKYTKKHFIFNCYKLF